MFMTRIDHTYLYQELSMPVQVQTIRNNMRYGLNMLPPQYIYNTTLKSTAGGVNGCAAALLGMEWNGDREESAVSPSPAVQAAWRRHLPPLSRENGRYGARGVRQTADQPRAVPTLPQPANPCSPPG